MRLRKVGSNQSVVHINGCMVFYSYETPVAASLPDGTWVRTSEYYSPTTSRHLNQWLEGTSNVQMVEQSYINQLVGEAS